jgi:hypothetical protein
MFGDPIAAVLICELPGSYVVRHCAGHVAYVVRSTALVILLSDSCALAQPRPQPNSPSVYDRRASSPRNRRSRPAPLELEPKPVTPQQTLAHSCHHAGHRRTASGRQQHPAAAHATPTHQPTAYTPTAPDGTDHVGVADWLKTLPTVTGVPVPVAQASPIGGHLNPYRAGWWADRHCWRAQQ